MRITLHKRLLLVIAVLTALILLSAWIMHATTEKINFSTQVKPILNKNCITCHGGVKAKAGFSLLFREEALANTESGKPAIIPGDADAIITDTKLVVNTLNSLCVEMDSRYDLLKDAQVRNLKEYNAKLLK